MDIWMLSCNDEGGGAPYFPHKFSEKHGVLFTDRQTAEKQLNALAAELFGSNCRTVINKDSRTVIEAEDGGWVMIERHGVRVGQQAQAPVPDVGDQAVLHDEKNGRVDRGWTVVGVSKLGENVTIDKGAFVKHLDRLPDGRYHHVGDVYATFEPAQKTTA